MDAGGTLRLYKDGVLVAEHNAGAGAVPVRRVRQHHWLAHQSHSKEMLFFKRVAENAPQTRFAFPSRSRGFSGTH